MPPKNNGHTLQKKQNRA